MRLHIIDGQLSTLPHRVSLDDRELEQIVRLVNAHHEGKLVPKDAHNAAQVPFPTADAAE